MLSVAEGSDEVVIVNPLGKLVATTIVSVADALAAGLPESVTLTVKLNEPLAVGIPEITPVDAESDKPLGSRPDETDQT